MADFTRGFRKVLSVIWVWLKIVAEMAATMPTTIIALMSALPFSEEHKCFNVPVPMLLE